MMKGTGLVLLSILLLLTACAPAGQSPPSQSNPALSAARPVGQPKRVVAGIPSNPPMLYNQLNVGGVGGQGSAIQDLVHVGLSAYDPSRTLHPRLAEAVPSLEN